MKITEKRLKQLIRESVTGVADEDRARLVGTATDIAMRAAGEFEDVIDDLFTDRRSDFGDGLSEPIVTRLERELRRALRRAAEDAVAIAHDLE